MGIDVTEIRARIAPSPTGNLHLGTARTALYNYLFARHEGGKFILRLEDTDNARSQERFTQDILDGLQWLGLSWDEGPDIGGPCAPYKQTEKIDHYQHIANKLLSNGFVYLCYATAEELASLKEEQRRNGLSIRYDNRGRNLSIADREAFENEGRLPSFRFRIEEPQDITWEDEVKGSITINSSDLGGDMVIIKSNGVATYNFAVVVDDVDMQMTHVLRGEDHIHNTAKQLLIFEALNCKPPKYAHTALIFDQNSRKLSKREHGEAVHINHYRQEGYMPEALINYLLKLSWTDKAEPEREFYTLAEAAEKFTLDRLSKHPAKFDPDKLDWFNAHYLRSLPLSVVAERARPFLTALPLDEYEPAKIDRIVETLRESITKLSELQGAARFFFGRTIELEERIKCDVLADKSAKEILSHVLQNLGQYSWEDPAALKSRIDETGKALGAKGKKLYWPVRAAVSGSTQGPDLGCIFSILGAERVKARLEAALPMCSNV